MKIPKQWILITLYMIFFFCCMMAIQQYAILAPPKAPARATAVP